MPKLTLDPKGEALELTFNGYHDYQQHQDAVKAIAGKRWDPDRKVWTFPPSADVAERLFITVKPDTAPEVHAWVKQTRAAMTKELVTPLADDAEVKVPWGKKHIHWQPDKYKGMFPHQRAFVAQAAASERVAMLLADDMGLGKCVQSSSTVVEYLLRKSAYADGLDMPIEAFQSADDLLAWAGVDSLSKPKLVIAPSSVKGTWRRELREWLGDVDLTVVDGSTPKKRRTQLEEGIEAKAWTVVNWEQIRVKSEVQKKRTKMLDPWTKQFIGWKTKDVSVEVMREPLFEETDWLAAIADEAHRAKNRKALVTKGLWRIDADIKLALTGTPLMNTPDELWPILKWLYPEDYTSYWRFFDQYVDYYEGTFGKVITGVKNTDALRFELSRRLVRRTKGEVIKNLPDKVRQFRPIELNKKQEKLYREAEKQMWFEVEQAIKEGDASAIRFAQAAAEGNSELYQIANGAARIVRLQQIASTPALLGGEDDSTKLDACEEIILDNQPKQFGVFTKFVGTANALVERLRDKGIEAAAWTGETPEEERARLEEAFQAGDVTVLVGTIGAMKEGVTLTAADTAIFIERDWVPAVNEQCEDRFHRIGQKNNVTIIILEAVDTVDTGNVSVANTIKHLIVSAVIQKDHVKETHGSPAPTE